MKKRTKEEQAAYMKKYRHRVTPAVTPSQNVTPSVTPVDFNDGRPIVCPECNSLKLEIKKLTAEIALLKLKDKKNIKPATVDTDLYSKVMAEKNERFKHYKLGGLC